jgi:hypothetical protein
MGTTRESSAPLLAELGGKPNDLALRERAARALQREGREADALALLTGSLRNLTAHEAPPLPCMCKKCLDPERPTAEAFGFTFDREFAVAEGRVLFYWVPRELARRRPGLRRSVSAVLGDKLAKARKKKKRS